MDKGTEDQIAVCDKDAHVLYESGDYCESLTALNALLTALQKTKAVERIIGVRLRIILCHEKLQEVSAKEERRERKQS